MLGARGDTHPLGDAGWMAWSVTDRLRVEPWLVLCLSARIG